MSTKPNPKKQYGFYSSTAAQLYGTSYYGTPEGKEVEVTTVGSDRTGSFYHWPDKRFVGEVTKWSRFGLGRPGSQGDPFNSLPRDIYP